MSLEVENEMPELDEVSEVDSLRSDNDDDLYGDSEDEYVPHPDEYSCRLQLISSDPDELDDRGRQVMVRAKWLEHVSSVEDTKNLTT